MRGTPHSADLAEVVGSVLEAGPRPRPGLVVGVCAGPVSVVRGMGSVAVGGAEPTSRTLLQIGSVTKTFTALALADAVHRGELTLDTPVGRIVPGLPTSRSGAEVTLGQLASHTAGLPRLPPGLRRAARGNRSDPYASFGPDELAAALPLTRLRSEPGRRYRYSNYGAGLLGEALARAAGLSFAELIARRVTGPLQLPDTVVEPGPEQEARRAAGHSWRGRRVPDWHLGALAGAGALWSTAEDQLRFLRAHLRPAGTGLAPALHLVQEPRFSAGKRVQLGLGWHRSPLGDHGRTALWHNGGTGGFRSFVAFLPGSGVGVVVLANSVRSVDGLGIRLLRLVGDMAGDMAGDPVGDGLGPAS